MNEQKFQKDMNLYMRSQGISSMDLYYANKRIENSMTPYILEERQMNVTQMDVFSRLMADRILWLFGTVDDSMMAISQAQMMYLDSLNNNDITLQISSGGGSILAGNSIIDVMNYISSDVSTVNMGLCASMAAVLLGAGEPSKRMALPSSRTMLHQSSSGFEGKFNDAETQWKEWQYTQKQLFERIGSYCGRTGEQIKNDFPVDTWFSAQEIKDYGLIDCIIPNKPKNK